MGGGKGSEDLSTLSHVPPTTYNVEDRIRKLQLRIVDTPSGGSLIGILQPIWNKAVESDMRLNWLQEMLKKELVVRDIKSF